MSGLAAETTKNDVGETHGNGHRRDLSRRRGQASWCSQPRSAAGMDAAIRADGGVRSGHGPPFSGSMFPDSNPWFTMTQ